MIPTIMLGKLEGQRKMGDLAGDPESARFLHEIEALSKALSLDPKPRPRPRPTVNSSLCSTNKKPSASSSSSSSSSIWSWRPLKALSHLRHPNQRHQHRFLLLFSLHVHSIERLPPPLADATLRVHWVGGGGSAAASQTPPVRALRGAAEFNKSLTHRCPVLVMRTASRRQAKYEPRPFEVRVSVAEAPGLDLGRHAIDLARLLPLTLEELEGAKSKGRWSTSYRLSGIAKGAVLNVSFGYSVEREDLSVDSRGGGRKISEILDQSVGGGISRVNQRRSLRRVGSIPGSKQVGRYRAHAPSCSVEDMKMVQDVLPSSRPRVLNLVQVDRALEVGEQSSHKSGTSTVDLKKESEDELPKLKSCVLAERAEGNVEVDCDEPEFVVIEKGVEIAIKDQLDEPKFEIFEHGESDKEDEVGLQVEDKKLDQQGEEFSYHGKDPKESSLSIGVSAIQGLHAAFHNLSFFEVEKSETPEFKASASQSLGYAEIRSNYKLSFKESRSLSLDDVTESVANEFLSMLGMEHSPSCLSYDSDGESFKKLLCREFEKTYNCANSSEDFDLSPIVQAAELEHLKPIQAMESKNRAKMLEEAEAEALMHKWGLDEQAFESFIPRSMIGFGSPIELSP